VLLGVNAGNEGVPFVVMKNRIVIIGNGIAGFSAAAAIRRRSVDASITMISAETEGLYSPCVLPEYISGRICREDTYVDSFRDYDLPGVKILLGQRVDHMEPTATRIRLESGETLSFDRLILAVGSSAIEGGDPKRGSFVVKSLADADALIRHRGRKAVVVGSGAIGIEVAAALKGRGYEVEVLEGLSRILPLGLDRKAADIVKEVLEENGIRVAVNERAKAGVGRECIEGLKTDRSERDCDTVVWAIGMKPNVELARKAGIKVGIKGGINVDPHMETNVKGIYACGDCVEINDIVTGRPALNLFWHNAVRQGEAAGCNSVGQELNYPGSENLLNFQVFGQHVVAFGRTVSGMKDDGINPKKISIMERKEEKAYYRLVFLDRRCAGAQFINPPKDASLIWNLIRNGRSVDSVMNGFRNQRALHSKGWITRVRPFFQGMNLVEGEGGNNE
jgi:NADH oxidase (H2O2-forming)